MKRNNLTTALIAGIAGVAGIASVSTAVNINPDGIGQILLYPYYSVRGDNNTLISVVNTTNNVKAVKVRFLEGKNSRECLDFNLYLSPYDVWTAALVATTSTEPGHAGEDSVKLITSDNSCLSPNTIMAGQQFLPYGYSAPAPYDELGLDMKRCTEGHFEMIEMGNVVNTATNGNAASAVTHGASGVPADCSVVHNNWLGGAWSALATDGIVDPDGSGGLFGSAAIVNVPAGTEVSYNADAIQSYSTVAQHRNPGDLFPNVASGNNLVSNVFYAATPGSIVTDTWNSSEVQAVSAVYMHDHIYGEFEITDDFGADTEWVVTFPTKTFYTDPFSTATTFGVGAPVEPFTRGLSDPYNGRPACESFAMQRWDREEQQLGGGVLLPSPRPPGELGPVFCWETNVLEFHDENDVFDIDASLILSSSNNMFVRPGFNNGWAEIAFAQSTNDNVAGRTYTGLPVTGFAVQKFVNGTLGGGTTLANYAGLFAHRYSKNIQ